MMSMFVQGDMRMVRAARSGDELDVQSAKLAGRDELFVSSSCKCVHACMEKMG